MPDSSTEIAIKAYRKIYPDFQFPDDFPENKKLNAIQRSGGRRIVLSKTNDEYRVFYEEGNNYQIEIPEWNKLIGCGG
jgi:hypothetical protein